MCPYKGNLPPEYELMHQFTEYQVGKGAKYVKKLITHNTES